MAGSKDNGKKGASKKGKKEPKNWMMTVIPLLLVFIMIGSVFAVLMTGNRNSGSSDANKKFDSIMDGLRLIPANASSARYVDLNNDSVLRDSQGNYMWLMGSLPPANIFNANPQRDLFAIYPAGFYGLYNQQFVSLTDFGTSRINESWPTIDSFNSEVSVKKVNNYYYYTTGMTPVISGMINNVASTFMVMAAGNASAYNEYADLFQELDSLQIHTDNATLQMVGKTSNLSYSDRYYVALTPVDSSNKSTNRSYSYVAVLHLNSTISDQDKLNLALLEQAMEKMGFQSYRTQSYDGYIVIEATGSLGVCIDDMQNRWGFIKYQASL